MASNIHLATAALLVVRSASSRRTRSEPQWIVRHRRIRTIPYAAALGISICVVFEETLGLPASWVSSGAFLYGVLLSFASLGILVAERKRAHQAGVGDR